MDNGGLFHIPVDKDVDKSRAVPLAFGPFLKHGAIYSAGSSVASHSASMVRAISSATIAHSSSSGGSFISP